MRTLVVCYSRTGNTRRLARMIADALGATCEEIVDRDPRRGIMGYLRSGKEASFRRRARIEPTLHAPGAFDLVVIGTPVWRLSLSSPVRTWLEDHKAGLPQVAFICTMGSFGSGGAFRQMREVTGKEPVATLALTARDLEGRDAAAAVAAFADRLSGAVRQAAA